MRDIELISFDLCPYVQTTVITLLEKNVEFRRTNIDISNKPDWFLKLAPLHEVPIVRISNNVLFESTVINEYLDETIDPSLHPASSFLKANNRAWNVYAMRLYQSLFKVIVARDKSNTEKALGVLTTQLSILETVLSCEPFFNGNDFSLTDATYSPFFIRLDHLAKHTALKEDFFANFSKLCLWSSALLQRESVKNSVINNFHEISVQRYRDMKSFLYSRLDAH